MQVEGLTVQCEDVHYQFSLEKLDVAKTEYSTFTHRSNFFAEANSVLELLFIVYP